MNLTKINLREKEFHNKLHSGSGIRKESYFYKALSNIYSDFFQILSDLAPNKEVLDYGCGTGSFIKRVVPHARIFLPIMLSTASKILLLCTTLSNIGEIKCG